MKTCIRFISIVVFFLIICTSCVQDERDQAKQVVQNFLDAVLTNDDKTAAEMMPFLDTLDTAQKDALYAFLQEILSKQYILSVPEKKGTVYTVSLSIQGSENSTIHYSFSVKKEEERWIIKENISQKVTYESFKLEQ